MIGAIAAGKLIEKLELAAPEATTPFDPAEIDRILREVYAGMVEAIPDVTPLRAQFGPGKGASTMVWNVKLG